MGEKFIVADGYFFQSAWAPHVGFDLGKWLGPDNQRYAARIGQRPKVIEAMKAEGLVP